MERHRRGIHKRLYHFLASESKVRKLEFGLIRIVTFPPHTLSHTLVHVHKTTHWPRALQVPVEVWLNILPFLSGRQLHSIKAISDRFSAIIGRNLDRLPLHETYRLEIESYFTPGGSRATCPTTSTSCPATCQ